MTESSFKGGLASLIIVLNLLVVIVAYLFFLLGGFNVDQFTTVLGVVVPMFFGYASVSARYFVSGQHDPRDDRKVVSWVYASLSFTPPILFAGCLISCMYTQAAGTGLFANFSQFKVVMISLDTAFSGILGAQLIYAIFEPHDPTPRRSSTHS